MTTAANDSSSGNLKSPISNLQSPILAIALAVALATRAQDAPHTYLFTSFRGNGEDGLRLGYSFDGYHWTNLPGTFLKPQVGKRKLMRDPSLLRAPDGTFHMVWTTGWRDDQVGGEIRTCWCGKRCT